MQGKKPTKRSAKKERSAQQREAALASAREEMEAKLAASRAAQGEGRVRARGEGGAGAAGEGRALSSQAAAGEPSAAARDAAGGVTPRTAMAAPASEGAGGSAGASSASNARETTSRRAAVRDAEGKNPRTAAAAAPFAPELSREQAAEAPSVKAMAEFVRELGGEAPVADSSKAGDGASKAEASESSAAGAPRSARPSVAGKKVVAVRGGKAAAANDAENASEGESAEGASEREGAKGSKDDPSATSSEADSSETGVGVADDSDAPSGAVSAAKRAAARLGQKKRPSAKGGAVPKWPFAVIGVVLLLVVAVGTLFSWDRWLRCDDMADFQGEWYVAGTDTPVVIDAETMRLTPDVAYAYQLDTGAKTLTLSFADLEGGGWYRFSPDRQMLAIKDGTYFWPETLSADFGYWLNAFVATLQGAQLPPFEGEGVTLLSRQSASDAAEAERLRAEIEAYKAEQEALAAGGGQDAPAEGPDEGGVEGADTPAGEGAEGGTSELGGSSAEGEPTADAAAGNAAGADSDAARSDGDAASPPSDSADGFKPSDLFDVSDVVG